MLTRYVARRIASTLGSARRWNREEEYQSYLSAVDTSLGSLKDEQEVVTEREKQMKELVQQIKAMITGIDEVNVKIARVAQFFWMAEDSNIQLPPAVVEDMMVYMMSFSPFPAKEVQFRRPEIMLRMYRYLKDHCHTVAAETSRLALTTLARDNQSSAFAEAVAILDDCLAANVTVTARVLTPFFIIAKRANSIECMKSALHRHDDLIQTDTFTHNVSYYIHLLNGLAGHGMIREALEIINSFRNVGFNSILATVCIDVCARSEDPSSAFAMYKVLFSDESELEPVVEVYSVLLYAVARLEGGMVQRYVNFICTDMSERNVRTDDPSFLNRLAISLFAVKSNDIGYDLYRNMKERDIDIWSVTEEALPHHLKEREDAPSVLGYNIMDRPPQPVRVETNTTVSPVSDLPKDAPVFRQKQPRVVKLKKKVTRQRKQPKEQNEQVVAMVKEAPKIDVCHKP
eukprot:TRINITY_DN17311_c0_g1_i1.p1 TRINITY_DN17311_c0_g1~~TRINITY_DN17311_c0_g1_i1.p1  ORF type:complete len:458 (+),score=112.54 TRINITY_DN17311_c0_g1_i1:42-1415(+)